MKIRKIFVYLAFCAQTLMVSSFAAAQEQDAAIADQVEVDLRGTLGMALCSASIVRFEDSLPTDKIMGMTNGHCIFPRIGIGKARRSSVAFGVYSIFNESGRTLEKILPEKLLYLTMQGTDVAFYQFGLTYGELFDNYGVEPYTLSSQRAVAGDEIEIITSRHKTKYSCVIDSILPFYYEEGYEFTDTISYVNEKPCDTIGGSSGSPIILAGTRTIVGIHNAYDPPSSEIEACEEGQDCSESFSSDSSRFSFSGNFSSFSSDQEILYGYGQQIADFYTCRDENGTIDPTVDGCLLTPIK